MEGTLILTEPARFDDRKQDRIHVTQMRFGLCLVAGVASFALVSVASAQLGDSSFDQFDHPATCSECDSTGLN